MDKSAPAFPRTRVSQNGMTQHMYIATQCLAGILARNDVVYSRDEIAHISYEYATALLTKYDNNTKES